jgi:hypothetical protein
MERLVKWHAITVLTLLAFTMHHNHKFTEALGRTV